MTQQNPNPPADAGGNGTPPPGAGGQTTPPAGTTAPEGAGSGGDPTYLKAEAAKAYAARDEAKAKVRELEAKLAAAAPAPATPPPVQAPPASPPVAGTQTALPADIMARFADLERKVEEAKGQTAKQFEEQQRTLQSTRLRSETLSAYERYGGVDKELFDVLAIKAIGEGKITADALGQPTGVEQFILDVGKSKPHLFRGVVGASIPGGRGGVVSSDGRKLIPEGQRGSLASGPLIKDPKDRDAALRQRGLKK